MLSNYQQKVDEINDMMCKLAENVKEAEFLCKEAFETQNMDIFDEAKEKLKGFPSSAAEIDNEIVKALALYAPEATDLREMVGYLKITNELVNAASTIKSYIKNNKALIASDFEMKCLQSSLSTLHTSACKALEDMTEMFDLHKSEDEIKSLYRSIKVEESKADDLYSIVQKDISGLLCHVEVDPLDYMTVIKMARKLERLSDHATAVAKLLLYIKTGGELSY